MPRLSTQVSEGVNALSYGQIKALRRWVSDSPLRLSQREIAKWAKNKFDRDLPQYTISRYLSDRYKHVDDISNDSPALQRNRPSIGQWPTLETILFRWQTTLECTGVGTSGDIIREKALSIWLEHPEARNHEDPAVPPTFGKSWLQAFKKRYDIKKRSFHGEAASIAASREAHETVQKIQAARHSTR
jgi:hypothetical protein